MLRNCFLCFCLVLGIGWNAPLLSQEQLGLRLSNFGGINTVFLNPAANGFSRLSYDINFGEAFGFVETNYGFLRNTSLLDLYRRGENLSIIAAPTITEDNPANANDIILDFSENRRDRYLTSSFGITGPSFMINLKSGHTFGAFTRARVHGGAQNLPNILSYYTFDAFPNNTPIAIEQFSGAFASWAELGLNYAYRFQAGTGTLSLGGNVRFLQGYEAGYFDNERDIEFTKLEDLRSSSNSVQISYGYTNSQIGADDISPSANGTGFGLDLGMVYAIDGYDHDYQFKFSASILDIGSIQFNQNVRNHRLVFNEEVIVDGSAYEFAEGAEDLTTITEVFSAQVLGDSSQSLQNGGFRVWLPTALALQGDYSVTPYFFVNATLIQRLATGGKSLQRGNLLALTPRLETRWLEFAMPVSLYNYEALQLGMAARLGIITIGTEKLGSWFWNANLSGMDFYVAVKFPPF
ncbi:MAG: DUF5723 family protein, partial [Bacteroidota bacterium]